MDLRKLNYSFECEFEDLDEFLLCNKCSEEYDNYIKQSYSEDDIIDILLDKYYNTKDEFYILIPIKDEKGYDLYKIFK